MGRKGKGLKYQIKEGSNFRTEGYTVDSTKLKSCYLILNCWFNFNNTDVDYMKKELFKFTKKIKTSVYENIDRNIFKDRFIAIDGIPDILSETSRQYLAIEINLFTEGDFHKSIIENRLNGLIDKLVLFSHFLMRSCRKNGWCFFF